ncbi:DNA primase [Mesorhizobium sp. M7A.F.Ca.CA.001.07.2.1]|uniref:DNA primase n=8 Tax=Phyllobacteriaceae TaxID=69277 RepID=UPI000FCBE955|nr:MULTISPECIES: DNA primase [Mesorhizobium]MCF6121559.1 DNA primase [Mesorhizobium ciceri]MCQ8812138.1 DNA primase [Mesorhizobium sp. SEMIA396]RUX86679.1 DNA primase [Mesorhizobium sp. M7A.F.Ca.CA.004.08.1.1]RUX99836.1 DNA primase [Mesorhizobium sp. M7A.F.Ca.CA.004.04.1.1]RUY23973.1 DNA primase [Mesorhizobium sp. M7A.F.Ca.CA.004.12.1.1]
MRFPPAFLDEIRDRVPISSVIGQRVAWDRKKTNAPRGDYWACCPFHGEKSPSFHCEDKKGRYHCFGCSVSGDHFKFLTELDGMSFPEAVEKIADMAGVPMPVRDAQEERREKERASLTDVMEMATTFFQERLQGPEGAKARAYLRDRGLTPATQQSFRLGFAPDSRNALKEHLAAKGVPKADIEACGLVRHGDDIPVSYDWFRDRIMFPIPDSRGKIIAFGGRALQPDALAKYMNSPDTELFHKGNVLYNFARARKALAKGGTVIAVEGYMDVIALAQAGFENVVAPLGTALTENQLELLWRMAPEPMLCFDGDKAGLKAAWRAADMALPSVQAGRSARFALLPEGKDPDDLVKAEGPDAFRRVLAEARPLVDLLWMRETAGGVFDTPERRAELEKTLRELTSRIRDESLRYHYQQEMRERVLSFFGSQRSGRQGRQDWKQGQGKTAAPGGQFAKGGGGRIAITESLGQSALVKRGGEGMSVREATIIVALINHPALIDENFAHIEFLDLANSDLRRLHAAILDAMAHDMANDRQAVIATIERAGCADIWERAVGLIRRMRQWPALETAALEDARDAFSQALHLQRSARTLHKELKQAEAALATDPTDENYRHLIEIQAQFQDVQATEALIEGFGVSSGRAGRA